MEHCSVCERRVARLFDDINELCDEKHVSCVVVEDHYLELCRVGHCIDALHVHEASLAASITNALLIKCKQKALSSTVEAVNMRHTSTSTEVRTFLNGDVAARVERRLVEWECQCVQRGRRLLVVGVTEKTAARCGVQLANGFCRRA